MNSRVNIAVVALLLASLPACMPTPASPVSMSEPARAFPATRLTLEIDPLNSLYTRGVLAVEPTENVRITVEGPDLASAFTKDLPFPKKGARIFTVEGIPAGTVRVVTLQWLDAAGQPIDALFYRAQGPIDDTANRMIFNNQTTAEGSALLALLNKNKDGAKAVASADIKTWIGRLISTLGLPNGRFLDADALADTLATVTPANLPAAKPDWGLQPGFVSLGFTTVPPNLRMRVAVADGVSDVAFTLDGEPVVLGPIPPRAAPYKLRVTPIPTGTENMGPDLAPVEVDVVVKPGETVLAPPISFLQSTAGQAMPDALGEGGGVAIAGAEEQLWLLDPIKYTGGNSTSVSLTPSVVPSLQAYRFTRAAGWTTPLPLPAAIPAVAGAFAVSGSKIFCFGGFVGSAATRGVSVVDTASASATPDVAKLPGKGEVRDATAGAIGDRIYLANPTQEIVNETVVITSEPLYVFDPASNTFDAARPSGPPVAFFGATSAVVGGKWYLFGGYQTNFRRPAADTQIFDGTTKTWKTGRPMPTARAGATTAVVDGKIWVIGGEAYRGGPTRAVEVYDPATDVWTVRAPLRTARSYAVAGQIKADGVARIVVAGGSAGVSTTGFRLPIPKTQVEEITP